MGYVFTWLLFHTLNILLTSKTLKSDQFLKQISTTSENQLYD